MSVRIVSLVLVVGILVLGFLAWTKSQERPQAAAPAARAPGAVMPGDAASGQVEPPPAADPGVAWTRPARWSEGAGSSMRLATYTVPAASGDARGAECAVFYFGPGQGGTIEDNLERWAGEFESGTKPERSTRAVGGLKVSRLRMTGTYRSHGGSMGEQPTGTTPHQALLGAIVEGSAGEVFFKLTGPAKTVEAAAAEFDQMLGSLHNH